MYIRERYLKKIRPFYDVNLIKVLTGIRRCGKSYLLKQIKDELIQKGVKEENIIYINFELIEYSFIKNYKDLDNYIQTKWKNGKKNYLFLDEIQKIDEWERLVNSYKAKYENNISIFISGSNSDLLSGELATLLSGRYVKFDIHPYSFSEVCEVMGYEKNKYKLQEKFNDYVEWGGMPQRFELDEEVSVRAYLSDLYDSIVMKDIIPRFKFNDIELFNRVAEYIVTTPSQMFSAENLANYFKIKDDRGVAKNTLYNYLDYMNKAYLINKVERYDVRGKNILNGKYKYYLTDLGIGQVLNTNKHQQLGAYLENIVYNELILRGYEVNVGTFTDTEIDFIATKNGVKEYYQVAYVLSDEKVIEREFGAFKNVNDNYSKFVITTDLIDMSRDGIIHKNIIDWLLEE